MQQKMLNLKKEKESKALLWAAHLQAELHLFSYYGGNPWSTDAWWE